MKEELIQKLQKQTRRSYEDCSSVLSTLSDELAHLYVKHYLAHPDMMFIDPQELDPNLEAMFAQVDEEVELFMINWRNEQTKGMHPKRTQSVPLMGSCHVAWREKERILKENHGFNWKSPSKMNPGAMFD